LAFNATAVAARAALPAFKNSLRLFSIVAMVLSSSVGPLGWCALGTKDTFSDALTFSLRADTLRCRKDHGQTTMYGSSRTDFGIETAVSGCETATLNSDQFGRRLNKD
jgi:hypothetical protein